MRSFYHTRFQFVEPLQKIITQHYHRNEANRDAFSSQSALLEILTLFQERQGRIVWLLNRFDEFYQTVSPKTIRTLRGLRDQFKGTLCYIVGMHQEITHLPDVNIIGSIYNILDTSVCWIRPLNEQDTYYMIKRELQTTSQPPDTQEVQHIWCLTGGHPALIRIICYWWQTVPQKPDQNKWGEIFLAQRNIQNRLERIWQSLTQAEQFALSELQKPNKQPGMLAKYPSDHLYQALTSLQTKGICQSNQVEWQIQGDLLAGYISSVSGYSRGKIWLDAATGELYQGYTQIEPLKPLERAVLQYLVQQPKVRHTHTELIEAAWPDDILKDGVSTESLYQVIRGIRKKIEPSSSQPCYILNWRGQPEGGYYFFPEGRPTG